MQASQRITRQRLKRAARRAGFTLIELIVVVTILVIMTGMVISKLDVFEMKAQKGIAATNMADVFRNIENYRVLVTTYPDGWDSLLDTGGQLPISIPANGTIPWTPGLHGELTGGPPFGSSAYGAPDGSTSDGNIVEVAAGTLSTGEDVSLGREGIYTLYDFPSSGASGSQSWTDIPGNMAGTTPGSVRKIAVGGKVTRLNTSFTLPGDGVTVFTPAAGSDVHSKADTVIASIYKTPGGGVIIPAGKNLVVLGFGPLNQTVGSRSQNGLMTESPFYPNTDEQHIYNRFLAVFETDNGTNPSRARLCAVLGADGDRMNDEITDFYSQNP